MDWRLGVWISTSHHLSREASWADKQRGSFRTRLLISAQMKIWSSPGDDEPGVDRVVLPTPPPPSMHTSLSV